MVLDMTFFEDGLHRQLGRGVLGRHATDRTFSEHLDRLGKHSGRTDRRDRVPLDAGYVVGRLSKVLHRSADLLLLLPVNNVAGEVLILKKLFFLVDDRIGTVGFKTVRSMCQRAMLTLLRPSPMED